MVKVPFSETRGSYSPHTEDLSISENGVQYFHIQRTISARVETDTTKTGYEHEIPVAGKFKPWLDQAMTNRRKYGMISPYFFMCRSSRTKGEPYTHRILNKLWNDACKKAGENITLYVGTKHSSAGQFLNEKGGTLSELQMITDHARLESVRSYASTVVARRKQLIDRKGNLGVVLGE